MVEQHIRDQTCPHQSVFVIGISALKANEKLGKSCLYHICIRQNRSCTKRVSYRIRFRNDTARNGDLPRLGVPMRPVSSRDANHIGHVICVSIKPCEHGANTLDYNEIYPLYRIILNTFLHKEISKTIVVSLPPPPLTGVKYRIVSYQTPIRVSGQT